MGRGHRYGQVKHVIQSAIALILSLQGRNAAAQPPEPAGQPLAPVGQVVDVAPTNKREQLEKDLQNPLSTLIRIPVRYTSNFEVGPEERTQHQIDLLPAYPFALGQLNVITRADLPIISYPDPEDSDGRVTGLGDMTLTAYAAPTQLRDLLAGLGPAFLFPTATDDVLGSGQWAIGPSLAVLGQPDHWSFGAMATQYWSFAGDDDRPDINKLEIEPILSYRLGGGISLNYDGVITADWERSAGNTWTLPVAGTVSYLLATELPMQLAGGGGVNVIRPDGAADWYLRLQLNVAMPGG